MSIDMNVPLCACKNKGCVEMFATLSALKEKLGFSDYKEIADAAYCGCKQAERMSKSREKNVKNANPENTIKRFNKNHKKAGNF